MCRLNSCCCCCSLESGGYIIGWFNVIVSALVIIGYITMLSLLVVGHHDDNVTIKIDDNIVGGYVSEWINGSETQFPI